MDLGLLRIRDLILHDVPLRPVGSEGAGPALSEAASPLDDELRTFFQEKIRSSLANEGLAVEKDTQAGSPVPDIVAKLLGGDGLVAPSQVIARHLYDVQTRQN